MCHWLRSFPWLVQQGLQGAGELAGGIGGNVGHAPGYMAVGTHQHCAAQPHVNAVGIMRIRQLLHIERQPGFFRDIAAGLEPDIAERPRDHGEILVEPVQRRLLARHVEPEMRETATRPVGRRIDAGEMAAARRAVGNDRAPLVAEAERLADAVQVIVEVVDPEANVVLVARADRLIHAQEEERRRIAAELHDDVCQRLALVCLQLDTIRAAPPRSQESLVRELSVLYDETDLISSDIHQFSRELHPAILERLGLIPALHRFCDEFTVHRKIVVHFSTNGEEAVLDQEVALVMFRIGQECLMNISKHSGAESCDVTLRFSHDRVTLEICDTGTGFDLQEQKGSTGLGLQSMRERLRSVSGSLRVHSAPGRGTRVHAEVPIDRAVTEKAQTDVDHAKANEPNVPAA